VKVGDYLRYIKFQGEVLSEPFWAEITHEPEGVAGRGVARPLTPIPLGCNVDTADFGFYENMNRYYDGNVERTLVTPDSPEADELYVTLAKLALLGEEE
jgi:hypothetical protein